jgi:hypothetical protein
VIGAPRLTHDGVDDLAGVGELKAAAAVELAASGNVVAPQVYLSSHPELEAAGRAQGYWYGYMCFNDGKAYQWYVQSPTAGVLRATVTFDAIVYPPNCTTSSCGMRPEVDMDMSVSKKGVDSSAEAHGLAYRHPPVGTPPMNTFRFPCRPIRSTA